MRGSQIDIPLGKHFAKRAIFSQALYFYVGCFSSRRNKYGWNPSDSSGENCTIDLLGDDFYGSKIDLQTTINLCHKK